jgi:hypothetical protein
MRPVTLQTGYTLDDFNALLDSRQFAYAEAITIRLADVDGTVLAYTNSQYDFTVPPCDGSLALQTYNARDVLISGLRFKASNGGATQPGDPTTSITVDEQSVTFMPNQNPAAPSMIAGVPFLEALNQRAFDGATIQRDRWFFDAPANRAVGGMPMFYGFHASVDSLGRTQAVIKVKSDLVLLNIMMPRNLYQPNCQFTVYSAGCGADPAAFVVHDVVGASPTRSFIPWASATAQFTSGRVFFESGPNTNRTATIRKADTTGLWLSYPLPYLPAAGDDFAAYPGCNRQHDGDCAFFGRQAAFRAPGEFTPQPEMAF